MLQRALRAIALGSALAVSSLQAINAEELCSLVPSSYAAAKTTYPDTASALNELEKHSIATWYSDRNGDYMATLNQLVAKCSESSRLSLVVYGIPNKDCEAGYSASGGTVKSSADYVVFLSSLTTTVGNRKALYVLEPDAVGLLAKEGGCGESAGYRDNLKTAVKQLSENPNAEIYLDIGYWMLQWPDNLSRVASVFKELASAGTIKGVTINTSNYRSNAELAALCTNFQNAVGSTAYHCIVDTSRNYNAPTSTEWCNVRSAGIGLPPTSDTGYSNLDYFMWIKPPGESDGACTDGSHTSEAMQGPAAGLFFKDAFKLLWNQGYFVKEMNMPEIDGSIVPTPAPTTSAPVTQTPVTPAPTTPAPETPTPAPTALTPDPTSPVQQVSTPAPTTLPPMTVTPDTPTPAPTSIPPDATTAPVEPTSAPTIPHVPTPAPTTASPVNIEVPTPAPTTSSPVTVDVPTPTPSPCTYPLAGGGGNPPVTPLPSTSAPGSVVDPSTAPTPSPTPCTYPLAGGDANQQTTPSSTVPTNTNSGANDASNIATPSPSRPTPAPTVLTPIATPASTHAADIVDDFDIDMSGSADSGSSAIVIPTPAPTSLRGGLVDSDADTASSGNGRNSNDDAKQVSTEAVGSDMGTTAGVLAVCVVIGVVAAIAAYMHSKSKKKFLEEPKSSPVQTVAEPQASYVSVL
ncbi:Glycoside hydrolase, partial [Globisporangium splendens]